MDTYKMIAVDLSKQQVLGADLRAIQQINFTANLDRDGDTRIYFIHEKSKRNYSRLFTRNSIYHRIYFKIIFNLI